MQYLLLANISLAAFFALYYLMLRRETFFQVNRAYLLGTMLLSFAIPFFPLDWMDDHYSQTFIADARFTLDEVLIGTTPHAAPVPDDLWNRLTTWEYVYFIGLMIHILLLCYKFFRLKTDLKRPIQPGQAFSFFKQIRVDEHQQGKAHITAHENIHANQYHSLDILVMECFHVISWFNPLFYLLKREVKLNHEYIADAAVCNDHKQKVHYAELLLHQAFMGTNNNLINHFKQKNLMKSRIKMLFQQRSARPSAFKYALVLPLALCLLLFTAAKMPNSIEQILEKGILEKGNLNEQAFLKLLGLQFNYVQQAKENGTAGNVDIAFTKSGNAINEIRLLNDPGDGLGQEGMRLLTKKQIADAAPEGKYIIRISTELMPQNVAKNKQENQAPQLAGYINLDRVVVIGKNLQQKEKQVALQEILISDDTTKRKKALIAWNPDSNVINSQHVDVQPIPPTGNLASFYRFIGNNYNYPDSARKAEVNGSIIVEFAIQKDGSLSDIKILRDLKYGTGEEAVRVLKKAGKWTPGYQKSKPVTVSYTLPIRLNLRSQTEKASASEDKSSD